AGARGRHLYLELRGLGQPPAAEAPALPQLLAQTVARLRAISRDVLIDCGELSGAGSLQGLIPFALGTRLPPRPGAQSAPHTAAELRRLLEIADGQPLYIWGLPRDLPLPAALRRRLVFVSGAAIGPVAPEPPEPRA